jgi:hypothetical protein
MTYRIKIGLAAVLVVAAAMTVFVRAQATAPSASATTQPMNVAAATTAPGAVAGATTAPGAIAAAPSTRPANAAADTTRPAMAALTTTRPALAAAATRPVVQQANGFAAGNGLNGGFGGRGNRLNGRGGRFQNNGSDSPSYVSVPQPDSMASQYSTILVNRSIFLQGRMPDPTATDFVGTGPSAADQLTEKQRILEVNLTFNGVTFDDGVPTVILEDVSVWKVYPVHLGEKVAMGKITQVTFNTINYTRDTGLTATVHIGQSLAGATVWTSTSTTRYSTAVIETPVPGAGSTGDAAADDILTRMKARRAAELGALGK